MPQIGINVANIPIDTGRGEPVPAGWYYAMIRKTEVKPTTEGTGSYLEAEHDIVHGKYTGRKLFARLNLRNPNQKAMEIAYKQLSAIGHAVGVLDIQASESLHDKPLLVRVSMKPERKEIDPVTKQETGKVYPPSNDIEQWTGVNDATAAAAAQAGPVAAPAAAPAVAAGFTSPASAAPAGFPAGGFGAPAAGAPAVAAMPGAAPAGSMPWNGAQPGAGAPAGFAGVPQAAAAPAGGMPPVGTMPPGVPAPAAPAAFVPPGMGQPAAAPAATDGRPSWLPQG